MLLQLIQPKSVKSRLLASLLLLPVLLSIFCIIPAKASAISTSAFNPGHIIDDAIFTNSNSMSVQDIQNFLNSKVPVCDTNGTQLSIHSNGSGGYYTRAQWGAMNGNPAPFTCLKDYVENPTTKQNNIGQPGATISGGESAAQIIWNAAQAYSINPQVIITTLQKEQGLVTDDWPWTYEYKSAMGYGCPDTAACDSTYYGFYNQVDNAAWQFRHYLDNPSSYNYTVGNDYILYNPTSSCGGSVVNIQNEATAALYDYTPYQPNQAALSAGYGSAPPCGAYGNRNFWLYFNDWFGSTLLPTAFKSATNPTIYIYVSGYKLVAPAMGILQDYSISPQSIQTLDQSTIDAIPVPASTDGISTSISYLVKSPSDTDADGANIYLISVGKRYQIASMAQFSDFGFNTANIAYLPLAYIQSFPSGGTLSNFIKSPTNNVFQVGGGQKRVIFDYATYKSLNPSDSISYVSYFDADLVPSGVPLSNQPIMVKYTDSAGLYLLANGTYYGIPTYDSYSCWNFSGQNLQMPIYQPAINSYISSIQPATSLGCSYTDTTGDVYLLSRNNKFKVPANYGVTAPTLPTDLVNIAGAIPTSSAPLKQYIKPSNDSTIWYLENGVRKQVPTYSNFLLLKLNSASFDTLDASAFSAIPASGIKLGDGQVIKTPSSETVYVVSGNTRIGYARSDDFVGYKNSWNNIETYQQTELDSLYPYSNENVSPYLYDKNSDTIYLADPNGCYLMDPSLQSSFAIDKTSLVTAQKYDTSIFPNFNASDCKAGSVYIKSSDSAVVYWVDGGVKHPITTWSKLVSMTGTSNPYITLLSSANTASIPTGSSL